MSIAHDRWNNYMFIPTYVYVYVYVYTYYIMFKGELLISSNEQVKLEVIVSNLKIGPWLH